MKRRLPLLASMFLSLLAPWGCVSQMQFDNAMARLAASASASASAQRSEIERLKRELDALRTTSAARDKKLADLEGERARLQRQLDEATAMNDQLRRELQRLGKDVDGMLAERGTISADLKEARARLEELRAAQAAAERRAQLFSDVVSRFSRMVDAGSLKVVMREGRLVLQLPNDVLFDSGKAELKPQGRNTLKDVANVLRTIPKRRFQVAGHTDNIPIAAAKFPSNWSLSTARAVEVVQVLVVAGVPGTALSAAGYGEYDPVSSNDSADGRARNRRIEITLQPDLQELGVLPSPSAVASASASSR